MCTLNFSCATFYQDSPVFGTTFWEGIFMCTLNFLVCTHLTAFVRAQSLEGTLVQTV